MGLLNRVKKTTGLLGKKASSALGSLKGSKAGRIVTALGKKPIISTVARAGVAVGKFAFKKSPVGTALVVGATGLSLGKKLVGKLKGKKKEEQVRSQVEGKTSGLLGKATKVGLGLLAGGTAIYGAEQVAEKLGVRGGAGFFGRRKKKTSKRKGKKGRRSSSRKPKYGSKAWMSYIRSLRGKGSTLRIRRKRGRRGKGVSKTELKRIKALIRRSERD